MFCKIRKFNHNYIKNKLKKFYNYKNKGYLVIERHIFKNIPKFLALNLIKMSVQRIGNKNHLSKEKLLNEIYVKLIKNYNMKYSIGGCIIQFKKKYVRIFREYNDIDKKIQLIVENTYIIWDNRFIIRNNTEKPINVVPIGNIL